MLTLAVRPWSFTMTAISVTLGSLLALTYSKMSSFSYSFNFWLYLLTLAGMILAHAATNLINDYFDVRHGVDKPGAPTTLYRPHPVLTGQLQPSQALAGSLLLYGAAAVFGIVLYAVRGWPIALLAITGGLASFFYTGGPLKYKYRAMGEVSVFLMWGPLMMLGSYFVQTGSWDQWVYVVLASLPIGIWVALVLIANNLRDIHYDRSEGTTTLGTLLGRERLLNVYGLLMAGTYVIIALEAIFQVLPWWSLLGLLTFPLAAKLMKSLRMAESIPPDADPKTAQLATLTGILLIISLLVHAIAPI